MECKITFSLQKDFIQVIQFLEENNILKEKRKNIGQFPIGSSTPKINRYRYKIEIKAQTIEADFVEYIESQELYLNDAWVSTRD